MTFKEREAALRSEFQGLQDWEARYKKIIEWGKQLPAMPEELHTEKNVVRGCQSQVWFHAQLGPHGEMQLLGDSDALLVKGLIAVLFRLYAGLTPGEILAQPPEILKELGFEANLTPNRSNGLSAMLKQIRNYAVAFDYLQKTQKKN